MYKAEQMEELEAEKAALEKQRQESEAMMAQLLEMKKQMTAQAPPAEDPAVAAMKAELEALLRHMCDEGIYGISRVMTAEEAEAEFHLSGGFAYVLESDGYTSFRDDWCRPIVRPLDDSDYKYGHATHGHMPLKGAQPAIYFYGPHFKKGVVIEKGEIVDQAPTYAKLLGVELPMDPTVAFFFFFIVSLALQLAVYYFLRNRMEVTYALVYDFLKPEEPQANGVVLGNIFQM